MAVEARAALTARSWHKGQCEIKDSCFGIVAVMGARVCSSRSLFVAISDAGVVVVGNLTLCELEANTLTPSRSAHPQPAAASAANTFPFPAVSFPFLLTRTLRAQAGFPWQLTRTLRAQAPVSFGDDLYIIVNLSLIHI